MFMARRIWSWTCWRPLMQVDTFLYDRGFCPCSRKFLRFMGTVMFHVIWFRVPLCDSWVWRNLGMTLRKFMNLQLCSSRTSFRLLLLLHNAIPDCTSKLQIVPKAPCCRYCRYQKSIFWSVKALIWNSLTLLTALSFTNAVQSHLLNSISMIFAYVLRSMTKILGKSSSSNR